jgi:hypothetical protein
MFEVLLDEIEAIGIHNLHPSRNEVVNKLFGVVILGINLSV